MEYKEYEIKCAEIKEKNRILLSGFERWLSKKGFTEKTIRKHILNADLYINDFLLYTDCIKAREGAPEIGMYLGYWFIKKGLGSSKVAIKESAASVKRFYQFMYEIGEISEDDLSDLKIRIKEEMLEWVDTFERYEDPNITNMEEVWGF